MNTHPLLINNVAFAKRSEHLSGVLSLADCHRLSELLESQDLRPQKSQGGSNTLNDNNQLVNVIKFTLDGETNAVGQHFLHLRLVLNLTTFCQRCLEVMPLHLTLNFNYLMRSNNSGEFDDNDAEDGDDYDAQDASQVMDLIVLIEDEIIMALPIAPAHESDCGEVSTQNGKKPNPFAVLKGLIKS